MRLLILILFFSISLFSKGLEKVSVQLKSKHQFQTAGFIIAKEKGFYKDLNLDVKLIEQKIGENILNKVFEERVTFGVENTAVVLETVKGKPFIALMALFQRTPYVLVGLKSSGIKDIEDLEKKILGVNGHEDISILAMLKVFDTEYEEHDVIYNEYDLLTNHVHMKPAYSVNQVFDYKEKGLDVVTIDPKDHGFEFYGDILFTTKNVIKNNPEMVRKFYEATLKGWKYALENIDETVDLIYKKFNNLNRTKKSLYYEANKIKKLSEYGESFGEIDLEKLQAISLLYSFVKKGKYNIRRLDNFIYKKEEAPISDKNIHHRLSKLLREPLYEMNNGHIKQIFDLYLYERKNVRAIQVYDNYLNRYIYTSFKENGEIKHLDMNDFPERHTKSENVAKANIEYKNKKIGEVIVYFDDLKRVDKYKKYLLEKKVIKICVAPETMPYDGVNKKGELIGFASDYLKEFSKKLNVPIKTVIAKNWSSVLTLAKLRKCDLISAMQTEDRKKYLNFTRPYMKTPIVIATNLQAPFIDDFKNLKKQRIGYPQDYAYVENLKKMYPNINLVEVPSLRDGLQMVKEGEIYGQIGTLASIGYFFQKEFTGELKITGKTDAVKLELALGVRNDEPILRDIIQDQIDQLDDAFHNKVLNHWINIKYEQGINYDFIAKILLIIFVVLCFVIYNHYLLKRMNKQLKQEVKKQVEKNRKKDRLMFHQSKLASMGQMINNIAHQWRQPLNTINSTVMAMDFELMKKESKTDELEKNLTDIELQTKFMSETIENFRNYFKPDKQKEKFLLSEIVSSSLSLLKSSFAKKNIFIDFKIEKDKKVEAYRGELIQVLISILNNAEDVLTSKKNDKNELKLISIKVNKGIEIMDNGGGIPKDIIDNIFEPYFTTKQSTKGTGIGLYLSKMIVEESLAGKISVENVKDGAKFTIKI